jgi:hypothetical protein
MEASWLVDGYAGGVSVLFAEGEGSQRLGALFAGLAG